MSAAELTPSEPVCALILGGTTTVGRALAAYLLDPKENRCKFVRLADRFSVKPPTTYIDRDFLDFLNAPGSKLEYRQVNLANVERHVEVFTPPTEWDGKETDWTRFDVLFDLTGEMGFDKPELMQISHTYQLAFHMASSALTMPVELRPDACIRLHQPYYEMKSSSPHSETDKLRPDGIRGRWWNETLRGIGNMSGINLGIVRCANWYGPGVFDHEVVPRLVVGDVYKYLGEEMKFLYNSDLRIHTVHAVDVAQCMYKMGLWLMRTPRAEALKIAGAELPFSFAAPTSSPFSIGALRRTSSFTDTWKTINTVVPEKTVVTVPMFNVTDDGDSTQDSLAAAVAAVWGVKYGFLGNTVVSLVEKFAKTDFNEMVEDVNEKHVEAWSRMLAASTPPIDSTPLSPFLDAHAFRKMAICLDSSKAKKVLGYKPAKPRVEVEELRTIAQGFQKDHIWPNL